MQKKLTITIDVLPKQLEEAYRQMAADEKREAEALEWAEDTVADVGDEPR
jgi:hypothetical protein